jgi:hypothetical protein
MMSRSPRVASDAVATPRAAPTFFSNDEVRPLTRSHSSLLGLFILRHDAAPPDGGPVLARIEGELYLLVFSDRPRALAARDRLGVPSAAPFYVCAANRDELVRELLDAGARGFIADYDPGSATFSGAGAFPNAA